MSVVINGTTGITNDGGYTGDGVVFADTTPANTLVTTTGGNVGIGTNSPLYKFEVRGAGTSTSFRGNVNATIASNGSGYDSTLRFSDSVANSADISMKGGVLATSVNGVFATYIDSSGNLLVNSASAAASEKLGVYTTGAGAVNVFLRNSNTAATNTYFLWGQANGSDKILWSTTGSVGIAVGQTYGNISDRKYKTNIVDTTPKLADVMRLKVRNFNTLSDPDKKYVGWIAQEFQEVFPGLVFEFESRSEGDATETSLGVKESALTPILVKAIQEQQQLITALTARVAALEGTQNV